MKICGEISARRTIGRLASASILCAILIAGFARSQESQPSRPAKHFDPPSVSNPCIAIVVDDIGGEWRNTPKLLEIDAEITYSVMPGYGYTDRARELIIQHGREMMLHMPMQRRAGRRFGPRTIGLWRYMDLDNVRTVMERMIAAVPEAVGANNHMGSKSTRWVSGMTVVMEELKKHDMYFVDSVTGGHKVSYNLALDMGLKSDARDIFLDHRSGAAYFERQLMALIEIAKKNGRALGICHPRRGTVAALTKLAPNIAQYGVRLVPASVLVQYKDEVQNRK